MLVVLAVCIFTYILQRDHLKTEHKLEALVSRESSFLFNNLVLLAACFTILWGTLFPVLSEYVQGNKVTMGAPWYNRVAIPIGLFLLFLTGVGPVLAWRSTSFKSLRKNFVLPAIAGISTAIILMLFGVRPWQDEGAFYSLVCYSLAALVITAITSEFLRGAAVIQRHTGQNLFASMLQLTRRNTRRYGGYIVHLGIVVMFIGFAGQAFNQNVEKELGVGDAINIGPYKLVSQSFTQDTNLNYDTEYSLLDVYYHGKKVTQLAPEKRFYQASQTPQTMVANHSTLAWDLYVVYEGKNPDSGLPIIKVFLNPLVAWIWIGVFVVILGTVTALAPNLKSVLAPSRAKVSIPQDAAIAGSGD
jgi:cytochrome c-type biogenesis protein CcmF